MFVKYDYGMHLASYILDAIVLPSHSHFQMLLQDHLHYVPQLLHYIASQLENMDEIEFWKIWVGNYRNQKTPMYHSVYLKDMTKTTLQSFMESENDYMCLIIKK